MIKIVADTTCGLPVSVMQKMQIDFVPQIVTFNHHSFRDDFELSTEEFLIKLRTSEQLPGTAAPPPAMYLPIFERILKNGDTALVIAPSSKLSGTYRSALIAEEEFQSDQIHIIDTKTVGCNLGTLVQCARRWADQGLPIDELLEKVKDLASRDQTYFLVPTLEYLHKGGRIGGATKLIGSILQIIPILTLRDGQVEPYDKVRSLKQAIRAIIELNVSMSENNPEAYLTIGQCDSQSLVDQISEPLKLRLGLSEIPVYTAPPAIVVHVGPGLVVTSGFSKS